VTQNQELHPKRRFGEELIRLGMTLQRATSASMQYEPGSDSESPEQDARYYFAVHATDEDRKAGAPMKSDAGGSYLQFSSARRHLRQRFTKS